MKKIISALLVLFMGLGFIPVQAAPLDDGGNSGANKGGTTVAGSTWNVDQSGYRITVVDKNKRVVATTVDFLFSTPSQYFGKDYKYFYTNSRFTSPSSSRTGWAFQTFDNLKATKQIDKKPMQPIYWNEKENKGYAGGEYFKEWFLAGAYGMDFTQVPQKPKPTPSSPKNVETGTSRPVPGSSGYAGN